MNENYNIFHFTYTDPISRGVKKEDLKFIFAYGYLLNPPYNVLDVRVQIIGTSNRLNEKFFNLISDSKYPFSLNSSIAPQQYLQLPRFPSTSGDLADRITYRVTMAINRTIKTAESKLADTNLIGMKIPRDESIDKKKIKAMVLSRLPSIEGKTGNS